MASQRRRPRHRRGARPLSGGPPHGGGRRDGGGQPLLRAAAAAPGRPRVRGLARARFAGHHLHPGGYAAGLLLVVPLGDLLPRGGLVSRRLQPPRPAAWWPVPWRPACGLRPASSPGCSSVAGQVMIPFAADLAPAERRGRVVARIMSGLLLGILLARTVSGLVAQVAGWRAIYWFSAALMIALRRRPLAAAPRRGPAPHRPTAAWSAPRCACWSTAGAPPPGLARGGAFAASACCGPPGLPAVRGALPLPQRRDRPVRSGGGGRGRGRQPGRPAGRRRPAAATRWWRACSWSAPSP